MTAPSEHAPLAPSTAGQWVNCSGSVKMQAMFPERADSPSALEGTAAHWIVSELMHGRTYPVGTLAPNGIAITEEMRDGAELFVENFPVEVLDAGGSAHVEERVECDTIHKDCWGTPDVWYVRDNVLHVIDYKFGRSYVDARSNWQLICYAAGIISIHPQFDDIDVELSICQPRCFSGEGPWRTWLTTAKELRPFIDKLRYAARTAMSEDAVCTAGTHCAHCSARVHCPSAQHAVSFALNMPYTVGASNMPPAAMGLMRQMIADAQDMLKSMAGGLDEEIEALVRGGTSVPGWELQPGRGKTEWAVPVEEVIAMGAMCGVEVSKLGVITPIQAAAAFKKSGVDAEIISSYSKSTSGALKLVASEPGKMARIFSKL
jgi:hypothetical protein